MQDSMDDNPMQFFIIWTTVFVGIGEDGVQRDHQVSINHLSFCIVEGDNVSIVVVTQKLVVGFQNLFIVNEEIADIADFLAV